MERASKTDTCADPPSWQGAGQRAGPTCIDDSARMAAQRRQIRQLFGAAASVPRASGASLPVQRVKLEDLVMQDGSLEDLQERMPDAIQLWSTLADKLSVYCEAHPEELGDFLDCGKLTVPTKGNQISPDNIEAPADSHLEDPEGMEMLTGLCTFLMQFMAATGQLEYLQERPWFQGGEWSVVVEMNFYPDRTFNADMVDLGVHKDTDSRNIFASLIFNNPTQIPATEWTLDEQSPDAPRLNELEQLQPKAELDALLELKRKWREEKGPSPEHLQAALRMIMGGVSPPFAYASWADEFIWHSTPTVNPRTPFERDDVVACLDRPLSAQKDDDGVEADETGLSEVFGGPGDFSNDGQRDDPHAESDADDAVYWGQYAYEAFLILATQRADAEIGDVLNLTDQGKFTDSIERLRGQPEWGEIRKELIEEIDAVPWVDHKFSAGAGRVEVHGSDDGRMLPTGASGRPRVNSDAEMGEELQRVLRVMAGLEAEAQERVAASSSVPEGKQEEGKEKEVEDVGQSMASADEEGAMPQLPKRTFIRTWVTVVRNQR